jgi:GR25 family glycosyltransferase involved in LPS biosynthesis
MKKKFEIIIVNLINRKDRKENIIELLDNNNIKSYKFFEAIDGKNIPLTIEIKKLFEGNDFSNRKGFIGCALSHYNIWINLLNDENNDYYVIFEDDIKFTNDFINKFNFIQEEVNNKFDFIDIIHLGFHKNEEMKIFDVTENTNDITLIPFNKNLFWIGGSFSYLITKNGARNILEYINKNNIKHGIDYVMKLIDTKKCFMCKPSIVFSEWLQSFNSPVDTDIQNDFNVFDFNNLIDFYNYTFIQGYDQINNDIGCIPNNLEKTIKECDRLDDLSVGFNTFGYIKSHITDVRKVEIMNDKERGIFLKMAKKYRIKMLCNWCDSTTLCNEFNNMSKNNNYSWNNIKIVSDDNFIDFYVIINKPQNNTFYEPEKTIIFQMEPYCYHPNQTWGVKSWGEWSEPDLNKFLYVGSHKYSLNNCQWQLSLNYNYLNNNFINKTNNKILSTICSDKNTDEGHQLRINFFKYLELKNNREFEFDVWGGINSIFKFKNNKGLLTMENKHKGIAPYKYYIMFENNFENNYVTEKLWEPIICECLCFYIGAPNVTNYINPEAFIILNPNDFDKNFEIINNSIKNDLWSKKINLIREEKYKILNYYNFFPRVERILTLKIYSDKINLLKKYNKIFILTTNFNNNYKINIFKKTMEEFGLEISYFIIDNKNKLIINKFHFYTDLIQNNTENNNYIFINENDILDSSYIDFFNHLLIPPKNFDVCYLYENNNNKWMIIKQENSLYYSVKKYPFETFGPYIISTNGIVKVIDYIKNNLKNNLYNIEFKNLFYEIYKKENNFNLFVTKNIFTKII